MQNYDEFLKDISTVTGEAIGSGLSKNVQNASQVSMDGMNLLRGKAAQITNVDYSFAKGNLFEYIEAAKFNRDAALKGSSLKAFTTDSLGDPHAAADILIKDSGKTVREVQAKFANKASDAVFYQAGGEKGGWGKYTGMERLVKKDLNYNEKGSFLSESKELALKRGNSGSLYSKHYKDVYDNLTDETHYKSVSSGGTTETEVQKAYDDIHGYAKAFEKGAYIDEVKTTSANMAVGMALSSGIVSGVKNFFEVYKEQKELADALADVAGDTAKGAVRGAATGAISATIRYRGMKRGDIVLSDSMSATIMAGGLIDTGIVLLDYARGDISADEMKFELVGNTVKSISSVYVSRAICIGLGSASPFIPIAVYTAASFVTSCAREIIRNAELNAMEYNRLAAIYQESSKQAKEYKNQLELEYSALEARQEERFTGFLKTFDYNFNTSGNYDKALYSIICFAEQSGFALQHKTMEEFESAMNSDDDFNLG